MQQQLTPPPRLVESRAGGGMAMPSRDAVGRADDSDAADKAADAQRIPRLFPSASAFPAASHGPQSQPQQQSSRLQPQSQPPHQASSAFPHRSAADIMLGLKTLAAHADRQVPILSHDGNPMPTFPSLRLSPSLPSSFARRVPPSMTLPAARFPSATAAPFAREQQSSRDANASRHDDAASHAKLSPVRFGEHLGRKNKRGEARLPDNATSPTARSQGYNSDREITLSPPSTVAPAPRILPVATTIAWRNSSAIFSPTTKRFRATSPQFEDKVPVTLAALAPQRSTLPIAALTRSVSGPAGPSAVTQPPVLVRKSSSKWRSELAEQDRRKSRERIQRALTKHADGDYETLLLLVASMEEELLHVKTNSREHYHMQAQALSSEIQHAALEH